MSMTDNFTKSEGQDSNDPEKQYIINALKKHRYKDIQNGNFEVLKPDP